MTKKSRLHPPKYNERKLQELILYVAKQCEDFPMFGAVKLNKLLFYSDFVFFAEHGKAITGAVYRKDLRGPVVSTIGRCQNQLKAEQALEIRRRVIAPGYTERRTIALRAADLSLFDDAEIGTVDRFIEMFRDWTASDLSELSHRFAGWRMTAPGDEIDYFTVVLADEIGPLSPNDEDWARNAAERWN